VKKDWKGNIKYIGDIEREAGYKITFTNRKD
jgi:hypothetical protein